jgi:LysM domain-containing protein
VTGNDEQFGNPQQDCSKRCACHADLLRMRVTLRFMNFVHGTIFSLKHNAARGVRPSASRWASWARRASALLTMVPMLLAAPRARAFPIVVQPGDTLAGIAQRIYGRVDYEGLLVTANGLEAHGGIPIVPGMRLEVPALAHRRVAPGDTWPSLATTLLGSAERAPALAFSNNGKPWQPPTENAEIIVPYNLRFIATGGETLADVAERFLGDKRRATLLATYNALAGAPLEPGQLVLIPLTQLPLTPIGLQLARRAADVWTAPGGELRTQQAAAAAELPLLLADVRGGRYADAVARGVALLSGFSLTTPQRASVQRQLLEAYAALGAEGRAADACREWRRAAPRARLSPVELSPKLLSACRR